jgi:hypothetical protein
MRATRSSLATFPSRPVTAEPAAALRRASQLLPNPLRTTLSPTIWTFGSEDLSEPQVVAKTSSTSARANGTPTYEVGVRDLNREPRQGFPVPKLGTPSNSASHSRSLTDGVPHIFFEQHS